MVFSSTGDTTSANDRARPNAESVRSGLLVRRNLLGSAVSGATLIAQGLFAALFPSDCRICNAPLENISRLPVCDDCLSAITPISGELCGICGERLSGEVASEVRLCTACEEERPAYSQAAAFGAYDGELRALIHLLKYEQVLPAVGVLGRMLAGAIRKLNLGDGSLLVVPVPLHASKRRQRSFNQSESIAHAALKELEGVSAQLDAGALKRVRPTVSQIGLTRPQRRENIRGAFEVAHLSKVAGRSILLVDDVLTTGTTASECARILRKAGAKEVKVATVARTLKNDAIPFESDPQMEVTAQA